MSLHPFIEFCNRFPSDVKPKDMRFGQGVVGFHFVASIEDRLDPAEKVSLFLNLARTAPQGEIISWRVSKFSADVSARLF